VKRTPRNARDRPESESGEYCVHVAGVASCALQDSADFIGRSLSKAKFHHAKYAEASVAASSGTRRACRFRANMQSLFFDFPASVLPLFGHPRAPEGPPAQHSLRISGAVTGVTLLLAWSFARDLAGQSHMTYHSRLREDTPSR